MLLAESSSAAAESVFSMLEKSSKQNLLRTMYLCSNITIAGKIMYFLCLVVKNIV